MKRWVPFKKPQNKWESDGLLISIDFNPLNVYSNLSASRCDSDSFSLNSSCSSWPRIKNTRRFNAGRIGNLQSLTEANKFSYRFNSAENCWWESLERSHLDISNTPLALRWQIAAVRFSAWQIAQLFKAASNYPSFVRRHVRFVKCRSMWKGNLLVWTEWGYVTKEKLDWLPNCAWFLWFFFSLIDFL